MSGSNTQEREREEEEKCKALSSLLRGFGNIFHSSNVFLYLVWDLMQRQCCVDVVRAVNFVIGEVKKKKQKRNFKETFILFWSWF